VYVGWWSALIGLFCLSWAAMFAVGLSKPMTVTDASGAQTVRPLRTRERFGLGCAVLTAAALGALLVGGAIPWVDEQVPDERLLPFFGVGAVTAGFLAGVAVASVVAWRGGSRGRPAVDDGSVEVDDDGVDDAVAELAARVLLTHRIGALALAVLCAGAAVFSGARLGAAWRGDDVDLEPVLRWLQPVSAIGGLVGLGEVALGLILLGAWIVLAVAKDNAAGAAVTVLGSVVYAFVALVTWPLGWHDEWLGFGRSALSLL
jgi:hypothetical protein